MKIQHGRDAGSRSAQRSDTFSGEVWGDPVLPATDGVLINSVFFAPGGIQTVSPARSGPPFPSRSRIQPEPLVT